MPSASRPSRISGTSGIPGPKQMKKKAAWRVLVALLVYNGEEFVGPCLSSLSRLDPGPHSVDVLVLDDASPSPGWSDRCREMAVGMGMGYYRTPRNLGIPRNMNLGMLRALHAEYDAVILLNSDTVVPRNLIPTLIRPLSDDPMLSSTTAWSNNVSIYSLPNSDPERLASQPGLVDWLSEMLDEEFAGQAIPIPSAVGFCMALPTSAIAEVGLMDPVFGRGYSEEIDWCLRSHVQGYHSAMAPSCFVYHAGSGITRAEGLIGAGDHIVHAHQAIIDARYPLYAGQLRAIIASSILDGMRERGLQRVLIGAARQHGYRLEASRLHARPGDPDVVRFRVDPDGASAVITAAYEGFEVSFDVGEGGVLPTVESIVGQRPQEIRIFDWGRFADSVDGATISRPPYRERVF
jgi:GT2 family glycosyltransferase